jgi:hypothetical protein
VKAKRFPSFLLAPFPMARPAPFEHWPPQERGRFQGWPCAMFKKLSTYIGRSHSHRASFTYSRKVSQQLQVCPSSSKPIHIHHQEMDSRAMAQKHSAKQHETDNDSVISLRSISGAYKTPSEHTASEAHYTSFPPATSIVQAVDTMAESASPIGIANVSIPQSISHSTVLMKCSSPTNATKSSPNAALPSPSWLLASRV